MTDAAEDGEDSVSTNAGPVGTKALLDLASSLAGATTIEAVTSAIVDLAAPAVGAILAVVAIPHPGFRLEVHLPTGSDSIVADRWSQLSTDAATPFSDAVRSGSPVTVNDFSEMQEVYPHIVADAGGLGVEGMSVHPVEVAPDETYMAIGLGWAGPLGAGTIDERTRSVVALCGAALQRVFLTREARKLGSIMDALIRVAPIGFGFVDTDLRYERINDHLAAINGLPPADHLGKTLREVIPDLADTLEPIFLDVLDSGRPTERFEIAGETPGDPESARVWEEMCFPVADRDGEIIGVGAIVEDVTERRAARRQLERLYIEERDVANRLQRGMMPVGLVAPDGYEVAHRYEAGDGLRVGGDWYDLIEITPNRFAVVIGDVVGHGLDAALVMVRLRFALAGLCHAIDRPGPLLDRLDDFAIEGAESFVATLFYGLLEPASGRFVFSSAGHPPSLLVKADGSVSQLGTARGTPIGIANDPRPDAATDLAPGDALVLYTDGLVEDRRVTMDEGLDELLAAASRPSDDIERYTDSLLHMAKERGHEDDLTMMVLRRRR